MFADLNLDGTNAGNLSEPDGDRDRITFTGDDVTDNHTSICFGLGSDGGWGTAVDVVIDDNRIHDCGRLPATNHDHGIYVESTRDAVITTTTSTTTPTAASSSTRTPRARRSRTT